MNPYTDYLRQGSGNRDLARFVEQWDRLERLVVGIYRGSVQPWGVRREFEELRSHLNLSYPPCEPALRPYWQQTFIGGRPTSMDPFRFLLRMTGPDSITGNWQVMQYLPAAREAINRYLIDHNQSARGQ